MYIKKTKLLLITAEESNIEELKRKAKSLEIINHFAQSMLKVDSVHDAVWMVAKEVISKLGYLDCIIYLREGNQLKQKAAFGPKNPKEEEIKDPIVLEIGEGITGFVAKSGIGEIIKDTSKDPRYTLDDEMRYSEIAVPIISQNEVIGVIDSEHPEKSFFSEEDLEILTTIASMLSTKIDQARALEEIRNHKKELQKEVAARTLELNETIIKLKTLNDEIRQSSKVKETLLKEIHHRVKNNLQIVTSLMNLHSYNTESEEAKEVFSDCKNRVKSMSLIHEQLYGEGDLTRIDAKNYIIEIGQELLISYNIANEINIEYELENIDFDINISVPFGLILNEILVNALKYAFPDEKGLIIIRLNQSNKQVTLEVADNGIGFDPNQIREGSLGLELIETLTEQINGKFELESGDSGTTCKLKFEIY